MKKFVLAALSLVLILSFQNCSKTGNFTASDISAASLSDNSNTAMVAPLYNIMDITSIQYQSQNGMLPASALRPRVNVNVIAAKQEASVTISEVDARGNVACDSMQTIDYASLKAALDEVQLKTVSNVTPAMDAGDTYITFSLNNRSVHSYLLEGVGNASGNLVIKSGKLSKLLQGFAASNCSLTQ